MMVTPEKCSQRRGKDIREIQFKRLKNISPNFIYPYISKDNRAD